MPDSVHLNRSRGGVAARIQKQECCWKSVKMDNDLKTITVRSSLRLKVYPASLGAGQYFMPSWKWMTCVAESAWTSYLCYCWTAANKGGSVVIFCDRKVQAGEEHFTFLHHSHLKEQPLSQSVKLFEDRKPDESVFPPKKKLKWQHISPPHMFR